jgi:hypothetical protein
MNHPQWSQRCPYDMTMVMPTFHVRHVITVGFRHN